jgi:hypothetical protein
MSFGQLVGPLGKAILEFPRVYFVVFKSRATGAPLRKVGNSGEEKNEKSSDKET